MPIGFIDLLLIRIFTKHFHVSTQRKGGYHILCLTNYSADEFWSESQGKFQHPHTKKLGEDKMTEFMDKDENAKDDNEGNKSIHDC